MTTIYTYKYYIQPYNQNGFIAIIMIILDAFIQLEVLITPKINIKISLISLSNWIVLLTIIILK